MSQHVEIDKSKYIGTEMSGEDFNRIYADVHFVKLTNKTEIHNNFHFDDGLNFDTKQFNPNSECTSGGIYFIEKKEAFKWIHYRHFTMIYIRKVIVPDDARVYIEVDKFKADKVFLFSKEQIPKEIYLESVKEYGSILRYVPYTIKNIKICFVAVKNDGYALQFVPEHFKNKDVCIEAVKRSGCALQYVPLHIKIRIYVWKL